METIDVFNTRDDVSINSTGDADQDFNITNTYGDVTIDSTTGTHDIVVQHTSQDVTIQTLQSNAKAVDVFINACENLIVATSDGNDSIKIDQARGDQKITTFDGDDTIIIHSVAVDAILNIDAGSIRESQEDNNNIDIHGLLAANAGEFLPLVSYILIFVLETQGRFSAIGPTCSCS